MLDEVRACKLRGKYGAILLRVYQKNWILLCGCSNRRMEIIY